MRCIGSDPRRAHGLAPVLVLADEPAQWPENTGERMVAALRTAAGKQPHSRFVALGTRPADPRFRVRAWRRANPSLAYMPDLEAAIRKEAEEARRDPALLAAFEALRLNLGTADTEVAVLLDAGLWAESEGEGALSGPVVWGIDLGTSAAQSAVAAFARRRGRCNASPRSRNRQHSTSAAFAMVWEGSTANAPVGANC